MHIYHVVPLQYGNTKVLPTILRCFPEWERSPLNSAGLVGHVPVLGDRDFIACGVMSLEDC